VTDIFESDKKFYFWDAAADMATKDSLALLNMVKENELPFSLLNVT